MSSAAASSSPAAKKAAAGRRGSVQAVAPAAPTRSVSFVTVEASGYSQLFATNCLPALFLAAVASELTHHIAQRLQTNLDSLHVQLQQHAATQPQPQTQPTQAGGDDAAEEKQQLSSVDSAQEQQLTQWQVEREQLVDRQQQYEAALTALSHTTEAECVFDVRDSAGGAAMRLFEQKEVRVKEALVGAGKYELMVARKQADATGLAFHPLQLPV